MSREFGSYMTGYFHDQVRYAADDCLKGSHELTRLWGAFFRELEDVAYAISSAEECDSGPEYPIQEMVAHGPALRKHLNAIEAYVDPYRRVAELAVAEAIRKAMIKGDA